MPPQVISLVEADEVIPEELFTAGALPVAVLLEGTFRSAFTNRMTESIIGEAGRDIIEVSKPSKMIVVADGDIIRNEVSSSGGVPEPLALGFDRYTQQTFGNKDFLVNCINYLVNDNGLIEMRSREIKPRLLDQARSRDQRTLWQLVNTVIPVILIMIAGVAYNRIRQGRYKSVK
jgi:ABC-2 type transport system permease protein